MYRFELFESRHRGFGKLPVGRQKSRITVEMDDFLLKASGEARKSSVADGMPIGAVLVLDVTIVGRGLNQRVQNSSTVLRAEMDSLENASRLEAADHRRAILRSTLSPCDI